MSSETTTLVIEELRLELRKLKQQAETAMAQVDDAGVLRDDRRRANSIAVIVKHLGNNLRSRWTDFYTTDGEKPDRNRDGEFVDRTRRHARAADGAVGGRLAARCSTPSTR